MVTIYHYGFHSCVPVDSKCKTLGEGAVKTFKQSVTLKPERYANDKIIDAIENKLSVEEIDKLADSLADGAALSKVKRSVKGKLNPTGHSYDAVSNTGQKLKTSFMIPF